MITARHLGDVAEGQEANALTADGRGNIVVLDIAQLITSGPVGTHLRQLQLCPHAAFASSVIVTVVPVALRDPLPPCQWVAERTLCHLWTMRRKTPRSNAWCADCKMLAVGSGVLSLLFPSAIGPSMAVLWHWLIGRRALLVIGHDEIFRIVTISEQFNRSF